MTASITFDAASAKRCRPALTLGGGYRITFKGSNTYTGITTVTAGQLVLDAAGGNAINGNLDINAPNTGSLVANVRLLQARADRRRHRRHRAQLQPARLRRARRDHRHAQRAGQRARARHRHPHARRRRSRFTGGTILPNLAGTFNVNKNTAGTVVLAGNNSYAGTTTIDGADAVLNVRHRNALGATGVGERNRRPEQWPAPIQGNLALGETVNLGGTGNGTGVLRNIAGATRSSCR